VGFRYDRLHSESSALRSARKCGHLVRLQILDELEIVAEVRAMVAAKSVSKAASNLEASAASGWTTTDFAVLHSSKTP
jgi:hypothetical protein